MSYERKKTCPQPHLRVNKQHFFKTSQPEVVVVTKITTLYTKRILATCPTHYGPISWRAQLQQPFVQNEYWPHAQNIMSRFRGGHTCNTPIYNTNIGNMPKTLWPDFVVVTIITILYRKRIRV
jgi:hypothetical protein